MAAAACAHDRAQDAKAADAHLTSAQAQEQADQNRLKASQSYENNAVQQNSATLTPGSQSEITARQDADRAAITDKDQKNLTSAQQDAVEANAALTKERSDTLTDAKARFTKADAKAQSAKNNTAKLSASKRGIFTSDWNTYTTKKAAVQTQIDGLSKVSNDAWSSAKAKLDSSLDELERQADNLEKLEKTGVSKVLP
jgi:hypothetical protein